MKTVDVIPFTTIGDDARGCTQSFSIRPSENFIYIKRKKGSLSGNTYHQGQSPNTNPKIFVLLDGAIMFRYRHIDEKMHHELTVNKPSLIKVYPYITHAVEALEDIIMLECNSIEDIQEDRIREQVILSAG
tara:strand:+ start:1967 stop:2359 length:393 start_codon:yes stop_codon:yes gene_type:complete